MELNWSHLLYLVLQKESWNHYMMNIKTMFCRQFLECMNKWRTNIKMVWWSSWTIYIPKCLLARDSFEAHITDKVKRKVINCYRRCTKYIQTPDLVWNKPFKAKIQELYDDWLANGVHKYTTAGNIKPVPRRKMVQWVLQTWESLSKEMIIPWNHVLLG